MSSRAVPSSLPPAEVSSGAGLDAWDWERLDGHLRPRLVAFGIRRFGCSPEEAEDLLQDVFGAIWAKRPRVRNVEGYLVAMYVNRCVDRAEERARRRSLELPFEHASARDPGSSSRLVELLHVRGAYRRMTSDCRRLIRDYCVLRLSLAEAAAGSGCTVPTVWKRIHQCLKRMRSCLSA